MGRIVITAKRVASREGSTAENVNVYSREDPGWSLANNLGEAVKYMHGVDISVTNGFGQATALTIHGSNSRQVLVMVDGIPFNTQLSGQADPTMIPLDHVERIEVIKGASSSAWGSSMGGVINVITKDVGDSVVPAGKFTSTFAEFSTTKNSIELAGRAAALGYFVSTTFFETDGFKSDSDVREKKFFGKLSHPLGDQARVTASFGYSGGQVHDGVNSDDTWVSMPYIARYGKLQLDHTEGDLDLTAAYKYNDQDIIGDTYIASTGALDSSSLSRNTYHGISLSGSLKVREDDLFVFGSDFDWHELKSSNYLKTARRINMQAPYMNYTFKWENWDFIPGLRYDHNQQFGSQTSPSFGTVYHIDKETLIRAKVSRAFTAPPLLWIYADDPGLWTGPNPNLKAERAMVYELGFETRVASALGIRFDLYRADIQNAINFVWDGGVYVYDNIEQFRRQGAELFLDYTVNDDLTVFGGVTFTDAKNEETGERVRDADIARHGFSLGADYKNKRGLSAHLYGYYKRWSADPDQANDRKFIFDARFTQEFKDVRKGMDLEIFLNIYNLTDSKYWSNPDYPLPGRYVEGGFSLKF